MKSSRRSRAWRTAALIAVVPLLLTGCASGESTAEAAAQKVVTRFFDLLESGHTAGISALLSDKAGVSADALNSGFYASAAARPTAAKVVSVHDDKGTFDVSADYVIKGEKRVIAFVVTESRGDAKISGWKANSLRVGLGNGPGEFVVNGSYHTGVPGKADMFVPLPGVYTFEYVDSQGFGTVDPNGAASKRFEVEFPIDPFRLLKTLPFGVTSNGTNLTARPQLLTTVKSKVQGQLAALVAQCTASGLVGTTCPTGLADVAKRGAAVDPGSVSWGLTHAVTPPKDQWGFGGQYSVSFARVDRTPVESADANWDMVVMRDANGDPILQFADRADDQPAG